MTGVEELLATWRSHRAEGVIADLLREKAARVESEQGDEGVLAGESVEERRHYADWLRELAVEVEG